MLLNFRLFALNLIDEDAREFYNAGAVSNEHLNTISERVLDLMRQIRPHAVALVDAWGIPDYVLDR